MSDNNQLEGIAVVGLAGRFPQAANVKEFWDNLAAGKDCFTDFSVDQIVSEGVPRETAERPEYVKRCPVLADPAEFDNRLFKYSPLEAELIDPQQRIMLECAWEALENAGCDPQRFPGMIGVWAGIGVNNYFLKNIIPRGSFEEIANSHAIISNEKDYMSTRIAYKLGLRGPAMVVQTACSSSLVAVNLACLALLTYQCDMALAGAVFLQTPRARGYLYNEGEIFSKDGVIRAFDKSANGTVLGEGCGMVVLRRFEDAVTDGDNILAVIRGSAVNNDGAARAGYTAPGVAGQVELITLAHTVANVSPDEISYIEAHGTGTSLGDPIELSALTQVFRRTTDEHGFCGIGSVKTNIGHLDVAAGIAGLIKTICALHHRQIPPTINFMEPNPELRISESPFYIVDKLTEWQPRHGRRIAGISSFGMGGTNAHVILEEYPDQQLSEPSRRRWHLFPVSAATANALPDLGANFSGYIKEKSDTHIADIAWTLATGRTQLPYRRCIVADSSKDAALRLAEPTGLFCSDGEAGHGSRPIIFLFSGQGSQYYRMGVELYQSEPVFREATEKCSRLLGPFSGDASLIDILYGDSAELGESVNQTEISQAALFTIEYSITRLLKYYGIKPAAVIGHSIGEYAAACEADIFSLEDALHLVRERGRLMQSMLPGAMIAIPRSENEVNEILPGSLDLAVINGPLNSVVSGTVEEIELFEKKLDSLCIKSRRLITSHAYHSHMMEQAARDFADVTRKMQISPPTLPIASNLTGSWIAPHQTADAEYWSKHLRNPVRFGDNLLAVAEKFSSPVLLEIGPGNTLCSIARQHDESVSSLPAIPTLRHPRQQVPDDAFFFRSIGALWCHGAEIDLGLFYDGEKRTRIPLPSYPFERHRFWMESPIINRQEDRNLDPGQKSGFVLPFLKSKPNKHSQINKVATDESGSIVKESIENISLGNPSQHKNTETVITDIWKSVLGYKHIDMDDNFFDLGGSSLMAVALFNKIEKIFDVQLPLATLYDAPTIRGLLKILRSSDYVPLWNSLVTINKGNDKKPPFFCVHAEGGNVLEYRLLSKYIGEDQPFFGIQAKGLQGDTVIEDSIEEMAASYIEEVKTLQSHGPYFISGYCLGGLVAYEMAQQLIQAGEEIELLILISNATPDQMRITPPNFTKLKRIYYRALERFELEIDNLSVLHSWGEKKRHIGDRFSRFSSSVLMGSEKFLDKLFKLWGGSYSFHSRTYILKESVSHTNLAYEKYKPKPISCPIHLFQVSRPLREREVLLDEYWGWDKYAQKGIKTYSVPGFHKNMLKEPYVSELAKKIKSIIDN